MSNTYGEWLDRIRGRNRKEKRMSYRCPRCGATMTCMSTASIPPIISYQCYGCGYLSKPVRETELIEILPEHLWQAQFSDKRERVEDEHTMEEFMYGQDMGDPEDGSL